MMKENIQLTIYLKDGRKFSGVYHYLAAWARREIAEKNPLCDRVEWREKSW